MSVPRRALLVVDVQQQYFDGILQIQHPDPASSLANTLRAMDVAAAHDLEVVVVQHELPEGAPVFAKGSAGWELHPEVADRLRPEWKCVTKDKASVLADAELVAWLRGRDVDTVTIVGFMTNNCDIATAAAAEELGLAAEVLSDATGAIHLANEAGEVSASQLHDTLLVLLHSNFAAVATTEAWAAAVEGGSALEKSDLGSSAARGRSVFTR